MGEGLLVRESKGIYSVAKEVPDEYAVIQKRSQKANPNLRIHYVRPDVLNLGVEELKTPQGSMVRAYNKERCICDLIKSHKRVDKQAFLKIKVAWNSMWLFICVCQIGVEMV